MSSAMALRSKKLPARPSDDLGYGIVSGGGAAPDSYGFRNERSGDMPPRNYGLSKVGGHAQDPTARVMLDGYRPEIANGFEERTRLNPMNAQRPQSSMQLNLNDSIAVHLLVETALGDSKEFEILSQDEVDDLKKQIANLTARIDQTRQNLAIQSKYRDAAISMSKLYAPPQDKKRDSSSGRIKNILGHNRSGSDESEAARQERLASEKKCEDLAAELWFLEKRLMEPQQRLLKHTAGILQMTHKGPKVTKGAAAQVGPNGIPGSPESMYTYSTNARSSLEFVPSDELLFDERSQYKSFDRLDGVAEFDDLFGPPKGAQMQLITQTEQKLEDLNRRLRDVITKGNPEREANYQHPPLSSTTPGGKRAEPGDTLNSHLEYLEKSITAIGREHSDILRQKEESDGVLEETLEQLNGELHSLLLPFDEIRPLPPQTTGMGLNDQMQYFQDSIGSIEAELSRGHASKGSGNQEQMEAVMMGLWDIIQAGEEEARQRKQERRQTRSMNGLPPDEDDSPDEGDANEQFSVQAFSGKVQGLFSQATRLKDQKKVLQRQIKQQRELNSKSDASKDAELAQKVEELQRTQDLLARTEQDSDAVREQLSAVMEQLEGAQQQQAMHNQARSADDAAAKRLEQADAQIAALEEQLQEMQDDHSLSAAELQGRIKEQEGKLAQLAQKDAELEAKEKELEEMNIKVAELQTEVTIARAELDGAYGTRAQRAAEVAANPAIQKEIDDLNTRNKALAAEVAALKTQPQSDPAETATLRRELAETIEEYEQMTKASIEWEKEREALEASIDKLRDERERLETELSDEKVRWLGMKSPGGTTEGGTGTSMLKNEFKRMMRDTRSENAKVLRAEQAERRKVEDELRALKRAHAQGPGRSPLSG